MENVLQRAVHWAWWAVSPDGDELVLLYARIDQGEAWLTAGKRLAATGGELFTPMVGADRAVDWLHEVADFRCGDPQKLCLRPADYRVLSPLVATEGKNDVAVDEFLSKYGPGV